MRKTKPFAERFWAKVDRSGGPDACWTWTATKDLGGYGRFFIRRGLLRGAHRVSYELVRGPIPAGLTIDHLCRNRACVNPDHLEPVTTRENLRRGVGPTAINAAKRECIRGHEFNEENTRFAGGKRVCRRCHRIRQNALAKGRVA